MRILVAKYIIKQQAYFWFHSYAQGFYPIHLLHNLQIVRFTSTDGSWKCYCEVYFEIFRPMLNTQICVKDTVLLHSVCHSQTHYFIIPPIPQTRKCIVNMDRPPALSHVIKTFIHIEHSKP